MKGRQQVDQIDPFFDHKREWSKVKDEIVQKYFACYLKTVPKRGDNIVIVDGFSGPGQFNDGNDGSPLILCKTVSSNTNRGVKVQCLFADARPVHRAALTTCLAPYISAGIAESPYENFPAVLHRAFAVGTNATLFFYLDPYGIKDLDLDTVRQIYDREHGHSTEVLLHFSIRTFMRMSGNWNPNDSAATIEAKVKKGKVDTVNNLMGGTQWQRVVTDPNLNKTRREDEIVNLYVQRLKEFFTYAYAVPIKEQPDQNARVPDDDMAKYHLIFATRSARAVQYMNDVALNALQKYFDAFSAGFLYDMRPSRYEPAPITEIKAAIREAVTKHPLRRPAIYETLIPRYFLQRSTPDYRAIIEEMTFADHSLFADHRTIKRPGKLNDDTLLSAQPWQQR